MITHPLALNASVLASLSSLDNTITSLLPCSSSLSSLSSNPSTTSGTVAEPLNIHCVFLNGKGNLLKDILIICRGLLNKNGTVTVDCDEEPWKSIKPSVRPSNAMLRLEIKRRWELFLSSKEGNVGEPRCKAWTIPQCNSWLDAHPISSPDDVAYLQALYSQRHNDAVNAAKEAAEESCLMATSSAIIANRGLSWIQKAPYLRLIHCLIDNDEICSAFLRRNTFARTCLELDGRNAEDAPLTCWEMMAILWNDPSFAPETCIVSMHDDYSSEMVTPFDEGERLGRWLSWW